MPNSRRAAYQRVLLKLSGEALMGKQSSGLDAGACSQIAEEIAELTRKGIEIGIVVGGGNIFRGTQADVFAMERTPADQIGMIATLINGLVLQQHLQALEIPCLVMSSFAAATFVAPYNWQAALDALSNKIVLIFVGGTGHPYFTTDTTAALRASEVEADILLKATKVDGIYSEDPKKNKKAQKFSNLTYSEVLAKRLGIMDAAAVAICQDNEIPICVFNLFQQGAIFKAVSGEKVGTLVTSGA